MSDNQGKDFFIGWQEKAPAAYASYSKLFIGGVAILVLTVACLFVLSQNDFSDAVFEFGNITTHEGVLIMEPVPMLKQKENGQIKSILLVGFGKKGAEADISAMEQKAGQSLNNQAVTLKGSLIYDDGKTLLELTEGADAFVAFNKEHTFVESRKKKLGAVSLLGEIYDPKCAFGVMKPGFGKPHRSCAIRCISGGIPPVLKMTNADGVSNYCILKGVKGEPINSSLLDYVADQIRICGQLEQADDWLVLYTDPAKDIIRLQPHFIEGAIPLCSN